MRHPSRTQRLEETPIAFVDLFVFSKASLQVMVLKEWSEFMNRIGFSFREEVYMG